ncbi:extracellular solute-binding protein [Pseudarthrobacter sp. AB1]|uniref:extracellular solute-binding protein n=1 Tax=Pseudarthrobacter sp. AB1 TaxID=2138309 RepID=UPI00186B851C|nr:extracellular solute-binding protein [Pseudarthrobacter sp. AB1]
MHFNKTKIAAMTAAIALTMGTAACSSGSTQASQDQAGVSGEVKLLTPIFEGTPGQKLLEDELLPEFYKKYPNVKVNVDYTTYGKLNEKLTTSIVSGGVPDVMLMGVGWIENFAAQGILADLGKTGLTREKLLESYPENIVDAGMWKDGVYAVPIMLDTRFGVARMDLLKKAGYSAPPKTWDELVTMSKALTVRDGSGNLQQAGFDLLSLDPRQAFETMLFSAGGNLFNADATKPEFNSQAGVDALQLMTDLINTHKVEDLGFSSPGAAVNPLLNGRAAMGIAHNNLFTQAQESAPEILDQLQPFAITGSEPGMFFGGTLGTVSAKTKNPKAAQALLEFLTSSGPALAANQQRGNVPALTGLLDSDYVKSNKFVQFALENLAIAKREGGPANWIKIRGDFSSTVQSAVLQQVTPQKALDDLAAAFK